MKISKDILDIVLSPYRPECKYLIEAELYYPEIKGNFSIPNTYYLNEGVTSGHFNAVELSLCYNQLAYTFLAEGGRLGLIPKLGVLNIEEFKKHQVKNMIIGGINKVRFKRFIDPKEFSGIVRLNNVKKINNVLHLLTECEFNDSNGGRATGDFVTELITR